MGLEAPMAVSVTPPELAGVVLWWGVILTAPDRRRNATASRADHSSGSVRDRAGAERSRWVGPRAL